MSSGINDPGCIAGETAWKRWCSRSVVLATTLLFLPAAKAASPTMLPATSQPTGNGNPVVKSNDASTRPAPRDSLHSSTNPSGHDDDLTHLSLEDLMNVEVTSVSKKKQSIADAPAAVSVISQEDISRSGFSTIPDLLRMAPGVNVARVNSYSWAVGVRGGNAQFNDNLLVLQDGRSLYSPLFAGVYWDTVDYVLEDLDRIEVIRGPGATLWGSNAVNGVINITSKDSRDTQGLLVSTRGSNDDSSVAVRYGGQISDDTTYRVYVKGKYDNGLDSLTSGSGAGDDWYSTRGGFRVDKHTSDSDTLTVQGDITDSQIREPLTVPIPTSPFLRNVTSNQLTANGNLLARWDHRNGDDSDFSLQTYYDYLKVNYLPLDYVQNTFDIDFHHRFKLGQRDEVTWGLGYRFINSNITPTAIIVANPSTRNLNLYSAFVQNTYTLEPEHWFVTVGSKFEHNDFTGFEVQPSARLLWTPNKQNSVWAAVSRAVRTPAIDERDVRIPLANMTIPLPGGGTAPAQTVVFGSHNFDSEDLTAYELGYRVEPAKNFSIDTAIFYNTYSSIESLSPGAPIFGSPIVIPLTFGNQINGETYGAEISPAWQVTDRWRLVGSYSLLEAKFEAENKSVIGVAAVQGSAPKNQAQVRSYFDVTRNLQFNSGVYYVGRVDAYHLSGYISTDLNLVWRPREAMEVSVGVMNLFDNHHPEFSSSGSEGLPSQTPRTFYAAMSYKF
jgi:iron complex outermembrane receptor protein